MNYEVFCFGYVDNSSVVVQKEYFDTYEEALAFEREESKQYDGISITPMNYEAQMAMRRYTHKGVRI